MLTRIRGFAAMNKLKKEALKVIAANLPDEEITGLREMFEAMDKDGRCGQQHTCTTQSVCRLHRIGCLAACTQPLLQLCAGRPAFA